jgi:uncharacterized protein
MSYEFVASRLDIQSLANIATTLTGRVPLASLSRLSAEVGDSAGRREIAWQVVGELRDGAAGQAQVWLHLKAQVLVPLICQRCLGPADLEVAVDRSFRFVATEAQAEAEDDASEEDVLVLDRAFDLLGLLEDELLMGLPVIPLHEICPTEVKLVAQDPDFEDQSGKPANPFAVLAKLRTGKTI